MLIATENGQKLLFASENGHKSVILPPQNWQKKREDEEYYIGGLEKKCYFADGACGIIGLAPNIPLPIIYLPLLPHTQYT